MSRPAFVRQPGQPPAERVVAVAGVGRDLHLSLPAGVRLLDALADGFAGHGFRGGSVDLAGLRLGPFAYVMPALSATPDHAAFYSEVFRPAGETLVEKGALTLGRRDGAPFFHAHAIWLEADGRRRGGHILPEETRLAAPARVEAFGFSGGVFEANDDPETGFRLFGPVCDGPIRADPAPSRRAWALRLRPNQDLCSALEAFCTAQGLGQAALRGGVGSTIGASLAQGQVVERFATEVFVARGRLVGGQAGPRAEVDAGLVDYGADLAEGRLVRGDNPVLMTFELFLVSPEGQP